MTGRRPWSEISGKQRQDPARWQRIQDGARATLVVQELAKLRESQGLTQIQLAQCLNVSQARVSRLENQEDVFLSTLRAYVSAMGGELRVLASFPEGLVELAAANEPEEAPVHAD